MELRPLVNKLWAVCRGPKVLAGHAPFGCMPLTDLLEVNRLHARRGEPGYTVVDLAADLAAAGTLKREWTRREREREERPPAGRTRANAGDASVAPPCPAGGLKTGTDGTDPADRGAQGEGEWEP